MQKVYDSPLPPAQWMLAELVDVLTEQARGRGGWTLDEVVVSGDGTDAVVSIMHWGVRYGPEGGEPCVVRAKLDIRVNHVAPARWQLRQEKT